MQTLTNFFFKADTYTIYYNGVGQTVEASLIADVLKKLCEKSYFSPAYGVSINELTIGELKKGLWFEMKFNTPLSFAEMPFEKLLINIKPDFYGFNIIRYNSDGGYDGRCYYLNLHNRSTEFYNHLLNIATSKNI